MAEIMPKKKLLNPKKKTDEKTDAQKWLEKIQRAKTVKEEWRKNFRVALGYDYWEGRQRPFHISANEWITINLIYSNLLSMLPSLYNTNPFFYVKLKRSFIPNPMMIVLYEQRGKIRQSMLNYLKEELRMKPKIRMSIFDAFFQFGVMKIYHETEMIENPDKGKIITDEESGVMLTDAETGEPLKEPNEIPASDAYKVIRIHPEDFIVDEDAGPLDEDVNWKAHRIKRKVDEIQKDKRYNKNARESIKGTELSDEVQKQRQQRKKGSVYTSADKGVEPDVAILWEVYDIKNEQWLTVAEGSNEFMIDPSEIPMGIENDCFVDLRFTMRDDSWYPIPPVSQWLDPQKDYCELRSKLATHRKRFNRKYTVYTSGMDETELTKLEIGDDGTIIKINTPNAESVVKPIKDAPLDQTHMQELAVLRDELTLLSIGPNQARSGKGVESATEADIIEKRLQVQEGDWIGVVVDFIQLVAEKLDMQVQVHITKDQAIKVSGPQGEYWELVRTNDYEAIEGEYEYSVNVGAMTPRLPEIERAQWIAFLNLIASAPQLALSKRLLKQMSELHHIYDETLVDEIYQIAQQMMSGQLPMPGQQGSTPGTPGLPGTAQSGMAMGMSNMRGG